MDIKKYFCDVPVQLNLSDELVPSRGIPQKVELAFQQKYSKLPVELLESAFCWLRNSLDSGQCFHLAEGLRPKK